MFFACDAFGWDPMQIENMWDDYFFKMIILKERALKEEEKRIKKETQNRNKGHVGGGASSSGKRVEKIPDLDIPNDPKMDARYENLIGPE